MAARGLLRDAVRVVLVGVPNVGKSSLSTPCSALGRLVSPVAGTTQRLLPAGRARWWWRSLELVDTAGVAALGDRDLGQVLAAVRAMKVSPPRRKMQRFAQRREATVELLCLDATGLLDAWEQEQLAARAARVVALTKFDRPRAARDRRRRGHQQRDRPGLDELCERLLAVALGQGGDTSDVIAATAARCHDSVRARRRGAERMAITIGRRWRGEELVAAELRAAIDELGQVVGAVYTDDLLDRIFSRFCIGK